MINERLIGKSVSFYPYRHDNGLMEFFPLTGTILRYVTLSEQKEWLLVQLNKSITFHNIPIDRVLIKRPIPKPFTLHKDNQLVHFKLVVDNNMLQTHHEVDDYALEFWALCK